MSEKIFSPRSGTDCQLLPCGLVGRHLGHSLSPMIHEGWGQVSYQCLETEPEGLEALLAQPYAGLNVTIPYKTAVIPFCSRLTPLAERLGAVNTLIRDHDGTWLGDNTDYAGLKRAMAEAGFSLANETVVIAGSGGASRMVQVLAKDEGAKAVIVLSRKGPVTYQDIEVYKNATVLVNTTPCDMYPQMDDSPVDLSVMPKLTGVIDLIYNPLRTRLLEEAAALGIKTMNGLSMLVYQAYEARCRFFESALAKAMGLAGAGALDQQVVQQTTEALIHQRRNIVLIGLPGVGKTTLGQRLAHALDREFVDLDKAFQETVGLSPATFISQFGDARFRGEEARVSARESLRSGLVIATGGGTPLRADNRFHLRANGWVIYLQRPLERLMTQRRTLAVGKNITELYKARHATYMGMADQNVSFERFEWALDDLVGQLS